MKPKHVDPCPVVWFDLDNGAKRTHTRFRALAAAHGIDHPIPLSVYSFPPGFDLADTKSVTILRDTILAEGARLVVVDTFINATSIDNENDNAKLRAPLFALRTLCEQTGATIIALHHPSKNVQPGAHHDDLRGGGAIAGAADLTVRVVREDPTTGDVTITATKTRGAEVLPFSAAWSYERDPAGNLISGRFTGKRHETPQQKADAELDVAVLAELAPEQTGPASQKELRAAIGCKNARLTKSLRRLEQSNRVTFTTEKGRGGRGKVYALHA